MADFSIIEKIKVLFDTVISTPFFIFYFVFGIFLLFLIIFDIKKNKKISKIAYIISMIFLTTFFLINYFKIIIEVIDSFIEILIKTLYFPNLGIYVTMLIIVNATLVICLIIKTLKSKKIVATILSLIIDLLFIMIVGLISKNKIDVTSDIKLYSDSTILTLLQLSMSFCAIMYILLGFISLKTKLKKLDKKVLFDGSYPDMGTYINNSGVLSDSNIKYIKVINFKEGNNIK